MKQYEKKKETENTKLPIRIAECSHTEACEENQFNQEE